MSGTGTCERTFNQRLQLTRSQPSWADEAVPLRSGSDHEQRPTMVQPAPRARVSRGIAIAGLCVFALGLTVVVRSTVHDGGARQSQSTRAFEGQKRLHLNGSGDRTSQPSRATRQRQQETSALRRTVEQGKYTPATQPKQAIQKPPAPPHLAPATELPSPVSVAPATALPPTSTPASPARPEFGL